MNRLRFFPQVNPDVNVSANDFYENINGQVVFMLKLLETQM